MTFGIIRERGTSCGGYGCGVVSCCFGGGGGAIKLSGSRLEWQWAGNKRNCVHPLRDETRGRGVLLLREERYQSRIQNSKQVT